MFKKKIRWGIFQNQKFLFLFFLIFFLIQNVSYEYLRNTYAL